MSRTLGLDLGPNSIGWALVERDSSEVIAAGVRVFPEGVDRDQQGGELSKNETRRIARGTRRQIARRAKRKRRLRQVLVGAGMLPACVALPPDDPQRIVWENQAFKAADPYSLRRMALDRKLEPFDLGRVMLHLCQRRGFLSNRKADTARRKETSDMLQEISQLEAEIVQAGDRTLGEHLAKLTDASPLARLRGRHTLREMYKQEFEEVWRAQKAYHGDLLSDELYERIRQIIFYQRPIRVPKSLVGMCELEPNRRRCPRADRRAQRFRMLQEVNNLLLIDAYGEERALAPDERAKLLEYLSASEKRSFNDIRKCLSFSDVVRFNLERGDRKTLQGMRTDKQMSHKDRFGERWSQLDEEQKNRVVRCLIEEEDSVIRQRAQSEWGLSCEQGQSLLDADLPEGYLSFSREAITKLLPHLERGLPLLADDRTPCAIAEAGYLRPDQRPVRRLDRLPQPPDLPNPIVRQALHEVHKVVNAIIRVYGYPDQIHIELAREVKGSARERAAYSKRIRQQEWRRGEAAEAIRQAGQRPSRDAISRYLLWEEQQTVCIYTGQPISLAQLWGGQVQIDHILPRARSLDDSMMNKVLCLQSANSEKGDRTPYEWLAESAPERYDQVCQRARKLPHYGKYRKFLQKEVRLDDFVSRQLNDTAYISRAVREYLLCLVADPHSDILCTKGQLTAELRQHWGLNTILRDDGLDLKTREDHRHHAIDAVITALTDRSRLQQLARHEVAPPPWTGFREAMEKLINAIWVSHRVRRKVAGALHEETIYGKTDKPDEFAYRKPLEALTAAEVERIRDKAVREKVVSRLGQFAVRLGRKKKGDEDAQPRIPGQVWSESLWMNEQRQIPIRKVRLTKKEKTVGPIRDGTAYVKPGNTHHLCLFELPDRKREAVFVTMLEAARRAANAEPIIRRDHPANPAARFLMSLSKGELVVARMDGPEKVLQFNTASSTGQQMWFTDPNDARPSAQKKKFSFQPSTLDARKITLDPLGVVHRAND